MNPFSPGQDVFKSQADDRFNSFSDPLNPVNTTPGNWGIDPAYMTPSYMSPFRPQYQGPQGNMGGAFSPTWFQSMNFVMNPFRSGGTNYGGNTWQQQSPFFDTLQNRPTDRALSFAQNWALPAGLAYGAFRGLEGIGGSIGGGLGRGMTAGILGGYASTGTGSLAVSAAGGIGSMAGKFALPALAAQGAMWGINGTTFDPYIAQRKMVDSFRDNFAGVSFGYGGASNSTGGGLNREFSAGLAGQMSNFAARDLTFDQREIGAISDVSARAGLLDNANPSQITSRLKAITRQVKLVMSVANTSDFREAIELLGKLQSAGATGAAASSVLGNLGGWASAAGVSTQRLMNTVGAQGQLLFGANGLTPFVGQTTAAQNYASMSAAFRSGLVSPALMARMGGVEGAAQSATSGMLNMANSPYASMFAQNAYLGTGATGSIAGNMSRFGGDIAAGGVSALGQFNLNRPALMSKFLSDRGLAGMQDIISQVAQITPTATKNGKVTAGGAYQILNSMGVSDSESRAMLSALQTYQSPKAVSQLMAGFDREEIDGMMKFKEQQGANYGALTPVFQSVLGLGRKAQGRGANRVNGLLSGMGGMMDSIQDYWTEARYGKLSDMKDVNMATLEGSKIFDTKSFSSGGKASRKVFKTQTAIEAINSKIKSGDEDAMTFMRSSGEEKKYALTRLMDKGVVDRSSVDFNELMDTANRLGTVQQAGMDVGSFVSNSYDSIKGVKGGIINKGRFSTVVQKMLTLEEGSPEYIALGRELDVLMGKKPGEMNPDQLREVLEGDDAKAALSLGLMDYGSTLGIKSDEELDRQISEAGGIEALAAKNLRGSALESFKSSSGDKRSAYLGAMQGQAGKSLRGGKVTRAEHIDNRSIATERKRMNAVASARAQVSELAANQKIDFSDETQARAALDNLEASGKFSDAVDDFVKAVDNITGKTKSLGNSESTISIGLDKLRRWANSSR